MMSRRWLRVRSLTPGVTILTLLVASGCSAVGPAEFAATGQQQLAGPAADSPEPASSDESPDLAEFSVGQCLSWETWDSSRAVPCDTPHVEEIIATLRLGETYPGDDRVDVDASAACEQAFFELTGITFDNSELDIWYHTVSESQWASADPQVVCTVSHPEKDLTDPVRVDPYLLRDPETGEVAAPTDVSWVKLRPGDCVLEPGEDSQIETLVPCSTEHAEQVYAEFELPDGEFPGEKAIYSTAEEECARSLDTFVHSSNWSAALDFIYYYPVPESWALGDREIQCRVMTTNGALITGSLDEAGTTISP